MPCIRFGSGSIFFSSHFSKYFSEWLLSKHFKKVVAGNFLFLSILANNKSLVSYSKSNQDPLYGITLEENKNLPLIWVLPLSWSKKTPGERCIWLTTTLSVPLTTKVASFVINGISHKWTCCVLASLIVFVFSSSLISHTTSWKVTCRGAEKVIPLCEHSKTSYLGWPKS